MFHFLFVVVVVVVVVVVFVGDVVVVMFSDYILIIFREGGRGKFCHFFTKSAILKRIGPMQATRGKFKTRLQRDM